MNILSALLTYPQTVPPPQPPSQQIGGIVKQVGDKGPDFTAIAPLIGITVTALCIMLGLMAIGGFFNTGIGGVKWAWQGGSERGAAAGRKGMTHGGAVLGVVALIGTITGLAVTLITAF